MKTGPDALGTAEKQVQECKTLIWDPTPSVSPKMSLGAQYMKTSPDVIGIAENDSGSSKHEIRIRCPRYRRK
jgi:hypothetical protein